MKMPRDLRVLRRRVVAVAACLVALCTASCMVMLALPLADADMVARRRALENLSNQPFDIEQSVADAGAGRAAGVIVSGDAVFWCRVAVDESGVVTAIDGGGSLVDRGHAKADAARLVRLRDEAGSEVFSHGGRELIGLWQPLGVQDGAFVITGNGAAAVDAASASGRLYTFLDVTPHGDYVVSLALRCAVFGTVISLVATAAVAFAMTHALRPVVESRERERTFILSASHGLKTPLMAITSACDVLDAEGFCAEGERGGDLSCDAAGHAGGVSRWLSVIREAADEMARSISSMLSDMESRAR